MLRTRIGHYTLRPAALALLLAGAGSGLAGCDGGDFMTRGISRAPVIQIVPGVSAPSAPVVTVIPNARDQSAPAHQPQAPARPAPPAAPPPKPDRG